MHCHPVDERTAAAAVVEEVRVRHCTRRGRAIDLTHVGGHGGHGGELAALGVAPHTGD